MPKRTTLVPSSTMLTPRRYFKSWISSWTIGEALFHLTMIHLILATSSINSLLLRPAKFVKIWTLTIAIFLIPLSNLINSCIRLGQFREVSMEEMRRIMTKSSNASCLLDPEPTWFLKQHLEFHLPVLREHLEFHLPPPWTVFWDPAFFLLWFLLIKKPIFVLVGSYLDLPWPPRAEEGLRVDSDTLRYLKKLSPYAPRESVGQT